MLVFADCSLSITGAFGVGTEGQINLVGVFPGRIHLQDSVELSVGIFKAIHAGQCACQSLAHERRIGIQLQTALKNLHGLSRIARAV